MPIEQGTIEGSELVRIFPDDLKMNNRLSHLRMMAHLQRSKRFEWSLEGYRRGRSIGDPKMTDPQHPEQESGDGNPVPSQSDVLSAPDHGKPTGEEQAAINREDDPPA